MASRDHKPSRADEQERVQRAGGFVAHRRVRGMSVYMHVTRWGRGGLVVVLMVVLLFFVCL